MWNKIFLISDRHPLTNSGWCRGWYPSRWQRRRSRGRFFLLRSARSQLPCAFDSSGSHFVIVSSIWYGQEVFSFEVVDFRFLTRLIFYRPHTDIPPFSATSPTLTRDDGSSGRNQNDLYQSALSRSRPLAFFISPSGHPFFASMSSLTVGGRMF